MGYIVRILCTSEARLSGQRVSDFLRDGEYFEAMPHMEAVPHQDLDGGFDRLDVLYDAKKRPIIISSTVAGTLLTQELSELNEIASESGISDSLLQQIASTRQIVAIDIDRDNLTDEAWRFCDCFESFVASSLNGIVYAPDDGFYDQNLKLIQRIK